MAEEVTSGIIKIMTSSSEKVGLPNYSSVDIGPISVTRLIEEGDDEYLETEIKRNLELVERIIADVREEVLASVHKSKSGTDGY